MPEEEDASRRSKSLDGDATIGNSALIARHLVSKDGVASTAIGKIPHQKAHKTPWGKVKDIIQTRKDSLKKRHRHGKLDTGSKSTSEAAPSDHEEETGSTEQARESSDKEAGPTGMNALAAKPRIEVSGDVTGSRSSTTKRQHSKTSTSSLDGHLQASDSPTNRRLTPVLTITLPSTEELRADQQLVRSNSKPPPSPQTEDRHHKFSTASVPATSLHGANGNTDQGATDDTSSKCDQYKRQTALPRPASASAGTSPPVHRRSSKWTKVKKAFLTSSAPGRREDDGTGRISSSVPSSPNRNSSFFDEMDTDELSSGEYGEIGVSGTKPDDGGDAEVAMQSTSIHAEIQRNYEELQQKLSQEFHKKLHGWERMKASSSACRGSGGDDGFLHHDKGFRRKMEEWERMKHPQQNQGGSTKHRDSVTFQTLDEDSLSPDFRKKLQEWQRIKKSLPSSTTPQSTGEAYVSGSAVPPQFRKKITEWQLWRTGSGKSDSQHRAEDQTEDFEREQQEWERVKAASSSPSPETVTSAPGQDSSERAGGTKTPSPGIVRRDSTGNSKGWSKKPIGISKGSVNVAEVPGSAKEKYEVSGNISMKSGSIGSKVHHKGKSQKEKELQWLEKELHKIEREKQRLEREREKYLEREARLEKMRRAMGSGQREQEVLIQTSTGFFRFQGISEKFTRRLYEWEKARGIGPEASTFALLDPGYRPSSDGSSPSHGGSDNVEGGLLPRSKSASSVTNLGTVATNVGTSSLSLNDVEVLEQTEASNLEDSRAASEPRLRTTDGPEDDEPAAVIVDVEDVIEETAAPLPVTPVVLSQTPVYCYAPEEVTRLIDSSGSDSERDSANMVQRNDSVRTESSYKLLEENINLLNKLKLKEDICRKLESEIENLEGKIDDVAKTHKQELQRLRREETDLHVHSEGEKVASDSLDGPQEELVAELRARIRDLEQRQDWLLREGETLQDSFAHHSEQQAALAQNLVGKMKQLQQASIDMAYCDQSEPLQQNTSCYLVQQMDAMNLVQDLSTQLLNLAEKLEVALAERNREVHNLRLELQDRRHKHHKLRAGHHWFSEEVMSASMGSLTEPEIGLESGGTYAILPRQSSEELTQLPSLLTNKVLELREGLNYLCTTSGVPAPDHQKNRYSVWEKETDEMDATATFVFKCNKRLDSISDTGQNVRSDSPTTVRVDSEGNTSPVTCITITPAFWKRRGGASHDQAQEDRSWKTTDTESTDNTIVASTSRGEETSPANRDSFCSAVSSASAASSVCDYEDDAEREGDSYVSEPDIQDGHVGTEILESEETDKKLEINDKNTNKNDYYKNSVNDDKGEDKNEGTKTIIKCGSDNESIHKNGIHCEQNVSEDHHENLPEGLLPGYYETEVYAAKCGSSRPGKQRKILKTRRVSDTHIGYKRNIDPKIISEEQTLKFGSDSIICNGGNGNNTTKNALAETCRNISEISPHTDTKSSARNEEDGKEQRELGPGVTNIQISESRGTGFRQLCSLGREDRLSPAKAGTSGINWCAQNPTESCSVSTPDNVFVKTTRKIFSPVRQNSGGTASSVISYVVGETCGMDEAQVLQEAEQAVPSPVISILRREESVNHSNENPSAVQRRENLGNNGRPPPSWMFTRNRSQSSSPALTRRAASRAVDKSYNDTIKTSDPNSMLKSQNKVLYGISQTEVRLSSENKFESDSNKEHETKLQPWKENVANKNVGVDENVNSVKQQNLKRDSESQWDSLLERNKNNKGDNSTSSSRAVTPLSSLPLLPQSPNLGRRDLFKVATKETAPSIRMMIAKYNQKLTEQQDGAGGRSPEVSGSGSASPVAWRSPVAERRVRAQMEKYQEEVQRVLQHGGKKIGAHLGRNKVQKSASEGIIRTSETSSVTEPERGPNKGSTDTVGTKPLTVLSNPRSILKCPSAGSIKSISTPVPVNVNAGRAVETTPSSETDKSTAKKPPSPRGNTSPSPSSPSSPEIGLHHYSPPPSRLRALRIQRAKEEFLTRGPGGRSWTSDGGTSTDTPSASVSPEPFWGGDPTGGTRKDILRPGIRIRDNDNGNCSRLSQVSVGSESSCDGSVIITGESGKDSSTVSDEGVLLVKSASAGMINVDPNTYRKFYDDKESVDVQPSASDSQDGKAKAQAFSRFGISNITSRFRKVKMRRNKDKDGGKMNTVSMLCRQSLLVDLHLSKEGATSGAAEVSGPSTSKSCPSSPVLRRPSSIEKPDPGACSAPASWILNPARRIFKPK
ncbi:hypothetical protein B7P43_G10638 [Cryptotermes secundus]|nr:uncharacterized protein LOC111864052 isoform X2 [Cryptotermes secundus]XP_023706776.1 uncharacterized protein LOC111864052 isoform X2 [Cryptotermes secundus]PNF34572.1 hypothetical protein B7P43_G10638 [Cryptotermes secundus]